MKYSLIDLQKRLLPDLVSVMQKRFSILQFIGLMEPVGRRNLSVSLGVTERVLRSEVTFLKDQNLISVSSLGMSLTTEGKDLLESLESVMREITGIDKMEEQLQNILGVEKVIIVSGNTDVSPWVKSELGRACAMRMNQSLQGENIIAVTGGSTMAAVAEMLTPEVSKDFVFVPARGGIGEDVQNQANTICAKMAERTHSKHRVLYVPDQVSSETYQTIMKEPHIKEVLSLIKSASMVLHGIGDAITMAERRKTSREDLYKIQQADAVGEAFGYYFNESGEVVHKVHTIGLQLDDLEHAEHVIAVAGGSSKGKAIRAYMKQAPKNTVLITDEGAALQLLKG
ncbi:sugar-binding transcriptional regulator [Bacillus sp. 31A1R]|uniref:Sugar-binding transcriptional regulator n=1 Tax=Robertmurraya mangrovi TaxID=3098077 RepID=A0ABU5IYH1_9BACI|nr:sugar-binding transcriptional regulator [Bacillus sp. 31A1R]MDZ5472219.1 sugar-binding transcriptional regulator [Bacillus sp. 31A1R]